MSETRTAETSGVTVRCRWRLDPRADVARVGPRLLLTARSHRAPPPATARAGGGDAALSHAILAANQSPEPHGVTLRPDVSSPTAPAVSNGGGRLSRRFRSAWRRGIAPRLSDERFFDIATRVIEGGGTWADVGSATGYHEGYARERGRGMGLRTATSADISRIRNSPGVEERRVAALRQALRDRAVHLPGGSRHPLYRKLRLAGIPRDAAIAECMR